MAGGREVRHVERRRQARAEQDVHRGGHGRAVAVPRGIEALAGLEDLGGELVGVRVLERGEPLDQRVARLAVLGDEQHLAQLAHGALVLAELGAHHRGPLGSLGRSARLADRRLDQQRALLVPRAALRRILGLEILRVDLAGEVGQAPVVRKLRHTAVEDGDRMLVRRLIDALVRERHRAGAPLVDAMKLRIERRDRVDEPADAGRGVAVAPEVAGQPDPHQIGCHLAVAERDVGRGAG